MFKAHQIYLLFSTCLVFAACSRSKKVDLSHINLYVKIQRFDRDLDDMRRKPIAGQAQFMQHKYGPFYSDFMERILPLGNIKDTAYFSAIRKLLTDKAYNDVKHDVDSVFPNLDKQEGEITEAFKYIEYYFPAKPLPKVYAYFSGFQAQISIGDGYFAIGLDMFLGENSKFYPALIKIIPHYVSRRFTPANITPRVVEGIIRNDLFPEPDQSKTLLDRMIYNGKVLYMMDRVLPDLPDSTKINFTAAQMKWCDDFKPQIWGYFLEENLLYETDEQKLQKYLDEAPFTPGLGEHNESAPRLGVWTGWQIVRQYMDRNPKITLPQLMEMNDGQKILNASKFHPEK